MTRSGIRAHTGRLSHEILPRGGGKLCEGHWKRRHRRLYVNKGEDCWGTGKTACPGRVNACVQCPEENTGGDEAVSSRNREPGERKARHEKKYHCWESPPDPADATAQWSSQLKNGAGHAG